GALMLALAFFGLNLTLRSRAFFHSLRAAYPGVSFQWRRVWGAYFAAVGFNNVVPARGGDIIKLFLTRSSIPGSRYPTVASAFFVESIFDAAVGVLVLIFAFTQGVFPKPPNFSKLSSFDISYLASHFRLTLFLITALGVLGLVAFAAFTAIVGLAAVVFVFRFRSFKEVLSAGRASREAERAAERAAPAQPASGPPEHAPPPRPARPGGLRARY